jgi:hypothetical protein
MESELGAMRGLVRIFVVGVAIGGDGTAWFLATGASHERGRLLVLDDGMWRVIPLPKELRSGGRAFTLAQRDGAWVVGTSVFGDVAFAARLRGTRWTVERLPDVAGRNLFARSVAMSERGPVVIGTSWIDVASGRGPRWYVARRAHGRWTIELRGGGWLTWRSPARPSGPSTKPGRRS